MDNHETELLERLLARYSQRELAQRLDVSQGYVSLLASGRRRPSRRLTAKMRSAELGHARATVLDGDSTVVVAVYSPSASDEQCALRARSLAGLLETSLRS